MSAGPLVLLYGLAGCPYSAAAREVLVRRGVRMREIDVGASPRVVTELLKLTGGRRIVPVVVEGTDVRVAPEGGTEF